MPAAKARSKRSARVATGEISHGTLRSVDLVSVLVGLLDPVRLKRRDRSLVFYSKRLLAAHDEYVVDEGLDNDLTDVLEDLMNAVDRYVPKHYYFGTLEGDGSCFGVWPCSDEE